MAAAPLRAPGGEVIGHARRLDRRAAHVRGRRARPAPGPGRPGGHRPDQLEPARAADPRGGALPGPRPDDARTSSGGPTPRAHFTFMADSGRGALRLAGGGDHRPALRLPDPSRLDADRRREVRGGRRATPDLVERVPLMLVRRDGSTFAAEVTTPAFFEDGRLGRRPGHRPRRQRARVGLERELRESEERYRYLVQNAPGPRLVDRRRRATDLPVGRLRAPDRLQARGAPRQALRGASSTSRRATSPRSTGRWRMAAPSQELRGRINLLHRDGSAVPAEFIAVASLDGAGRFIGANGSVRDMRDRDRLEHELRALRGALPHTSPRLARHRLRDRRRRAASRSCPSRVRRDARLRASATCSGGRSLEFVALGWDEAARHALRGHARRPRPRAR